MKIALGNSRMDKKWKNRDISWEKFKDIIRVTKRTTETVSEFRKLGKAQQDRVKDIGGFVGGALREGKRRNGYVLCRSLLTLDMDYATPGVWDQIEALYDWRCCLYSTHKHTPSAPRLRLIIPLAREVTEDEYPALGRMVASDIGIDAFDDTTYEPSRLMYWPSTPADGEFVFQEKDGELLDPDRYLARYADWRDCAMWPTSKRQSEVMHKQLAKQADPLDKGGVIGAFCRAYPIADAMETFLADIYEPSAMSGRYDYIPADSSAGVVIYDDKWAYSHHATDPACGKLMNAFDLVRIHKFGEMDEQASFKAMADFAVRDERVKAQLAEERRAQAETDFVDEANWQNQLELEKSGKVKDTLDNIVLILQRDDKLQSIAFNCHRDGIDAKDELPWKQVKDGWNDADNAALKVYLYRSYGIYSPTKTKDAVLAVAASRAYHPVREYLQKLPEWDGIKRVDALLVDYFGAEKNSYTESVIRKTLTAAVARIYHPGTKFDSVLILNGPQGIGKSTFFAKLAGMWFSDSLSLTDMRDKSGPEKLQGYWILELGELAGMRKTDVETVKSFISRVDDKYRASYGLNVESHPRQCIIVGSTNAESGFLRDITGNRRFWPVRISGNGTKKPWQLAKEEVEQIWAETIAIYKNGENLYLEGQDATLAMSEQAGAMESDEREGIVRNYLNTLLPDEWDTMSLYERRSFLNGSEFGAPNRVGKNSRQLVCNMEIWCECFGKEASALKRTDSYEISSVMRKIEGWGKYTDNTSGLYSFPIYGRQRAMQRILPEQKEQDK